MVVKRDVLIENHKDYFAEFLWDERRKESCTKILLDIHKILGERDIPFWIFFGTLLGIYRSGNLIDHDVDCDIAMLGEDFEKLLDCEKRFKKLGCDDYGIERDDFATIYRDDGHCDIYFFKSRSIGRKHRGIILPRNTFSGTETIKWHDKSWRLVKNPEKCLEIIYGLDWKIPNNNFRHSYNVVVRSDENAF